MNVEPPTERLLSVVQRIPSSSLGESQQEHSTVPFYSIIMCGVDMVGITLEILINGGSVLFPNVNQKERKMLAKRTCCLQFSLILTRSCKLITDNVNLAV